MKFYSNFIPIFLGYTKEDVRINFSLHYTHFFSFPPIQDEAYWKMKRMENYTISFTVKTAHMYQTNFKNNNLPTYLPIFRHLFLKSFIHTTFTSLFFLFSLALHIRKLPATMICWPSLSLWQREDWMQKAICVTKISSLVSFNNDNNNRIQHN